MQAKTYEPSMLISPNIESTRKGGKVQVGTGIVQYIRRPYAHFGDTIRILYASESAETISVRYVSVRSYPYTYDLYDVFTVSQYGNILFVNSV